MPLLTLSSMRVIRRLVLPVAIGSVVTTIGLGLSGGRAFQGLAQGDPSAFLETAAFMGGYIVIGLLIIGLPSALALRRWRFSFAVCLPLLLIIGALGGALLAAGSQFIWDREMHLVHLLVPGLIAAPFGMAAALIWSLLNADLFGHDPAPL
jgi:hypothetical protein